MRGASSILKNYYMGGGGLKINRRKQIEKLINRSGDRIINDVSKPFPY